MNNCQNIRTSAEKNINAKDPKAIIEIASPISNERKKFQKPMSQASPTVVIKDLEFIVLSRCSAVFPSGRRGIVRAWFCDILGSENEQKKQHETTGRLLADAVYGANTDNIYIPYTPPEEALRWQKLPNNAMFV